MSLWMLSKIDNVTFDEDKSCIYMASLNHIPANGPIEAEV